VALEPPSTKAYLKKMFLEKRNARDRADELQKKNNTNKLRAKQAKK